MFSLNEERKEKEMNNECELGGLWMRRYGAKLPCVCPPSVGHRGVEVGGCGCCDTFLEKQQRAVVQQTHTHK